MRLASLIGRIIFGGYFFYNGLNHFLSMGMMTGYAAAKGVPLPQLAVPVAGLLILVGGAMILLGWRVDIGAWLVVAFLVPVSLMMHQFWAADAASKMNEMINFTKNFALIGASLMIASVRYWPLGVEKPVKIAL